MGSNANPVVRHGGIRERLWLGIGGLLLVLLLTASLAVWISLRGNLEIEQTFKNNGDSIAYMHELTDALDQVDTWAQAQAQRPHPGNLDAIAVPRATVTRNLLSELPNVTEKGEREAALELQSSWDAYEAALPAVLDRELDTSRRRALYRARLAPTYGRMRELAWVIADLNLKNARFKDHGRKVLASEFQFMVLLLLAGVIGGVAFTLRMGRALVDPVLELTEGVRALGRGRLDGRVTVTGDDELGELGRSFNAMASRLRDLEQGFRAKLLRTQRTTQLAINSLSDPVAVLGLDRKVELCNPAAEKLFGLRLGEGFEDGPLAFLDVHVRPVLEQGQAYEPADYASAIQVQRQGKERYILPRLLPVKDPRGNIVGVTLVLADVTGLRKLDEMKNGMLSTVSHELKNPMTSLRMAVYLLGEDFEAGRAGRQADLLSTMKDNVERMHGVLEELLELGRLESGDLLRLEVKPAGELLREMLMPLRPALESQGYSLELLAEDALPPVAVDAGRLKLVFSNLLDNAARHSPPKGKLTVGAIQEGTGVRFWVQDQGPGVPKVFERRIFERFFRVPGQSQGTGLGLGLAIACEITELHGGHLQLDPVRRGARFSFLLPFVEQPYIPSPG
jgi:two-component system, NtrC family, sensor histidine kinase KinB